MKIKFLIFSIICLLSCSCSEKELEPIEPAGDAPAQVTNVSVTPIAGGAVIKYSLPDDSRLLGVKAVYTLTNGRSFEKLVSSYDNEVKIEGYVDRDEHTVQLYTVNRAMQMSEPLSVKFNPKKSGLESAVETMKIERDFGGARYTWENEDRAVLTLELLTTDSLGSIVPMKVITTQSLSGEQSLHGYNTEPRWFAAVFHDNFDNVSDTIFPLDNNGRRIKLSPMYEEKLDKTIMSIMLLNNDQSFSKEGSNENLINDNYEDFGHTEYSNCLPAAVTIDLGQKAKISRITINARPYGGSYFSWGNPREFEVWSCDHTPDKSGDWNDWTKIMDCTVVKPSGIDGTDTDEDMEAGRAGADFSMPLEADATQYLRLNVTRVWTPNTFCHIAEITVYGDPNI